ncbi:hypothetical protein FB451DRAFT_1054349 [Mycena latifolia]|nr:hypothetical protein FB451DRAFT_1054349 [Mycena latifolia]
MQQQRMPPLPARLGLACYQCFKEENTPLSRCSGCHRISYCSIDWKQHKPMCKALENGNPLAVAILFFSLPNEPTTAYSQKVGAGRGGFRADLITRQPTMVEGNLVGWEPRCMVWCVFRLLHPSPCPQCNVSFCCSPAHWEAAHVLHHAPCEDGYDGLSHCEMNREVHGDVMFEEAMVSAYDASGQFMWAPDRVKSSWSALVRTSWASEFSDLMCSSAGVPDSHPMAPWIRAAFDNLTMPMTILYALERLKADDAWTKKHTLTIHASSSFGVARFNFDAQQIIGTATKEIEAALIFEEILHRLPEIKTLKLLLCGPEVPGLRIPKVIPTETCPSLACSRSTYHSYVQNQGTKFEKPDLCIAFNSGASQESHTWPATLKVLVERKIPSVFTAYNREEAEGEAALLRAAGARLLPGMGPIQNPWGSIKVIPEPNKIYGFYAVNGWLAGGFQ